jgi:hypothetical protein
MQQEELNELARRCQQENDTYRRTGSSDPSYCLKLFRMALEEDREDAWEKIIECYIPNLRNKFYAHPSASLLREYQDDIIMMTFERILEQHKKKPLQVTSLGAMLNYLYACFYTAILLSKRDKDKERLVAGTLDDFVGIPGPDPTEASLDTSGAREIWKRVKSCTNDVSDERVMYLWLVQDSTAPEIVRYLPGDNLTREKVHQIVERVFRRYRKRYPRSTDI